MHIYIYIKKHKVSMKKGSLVGIILAEQCFFLLHMHNKYEKYIRNIIFALEYIRIGIWNDNYNK